MRLQDLYARYSHQVQFLVIYIREAHSTDGWSIPNRVKLADPQTLEERRKAAGQCETALAHGVPTLVDEMDDAVMTAYAAWPDRLYLVDTEGCVAYAGGQGPFGFKPAELGKAIDALIG
ncbi:MAG: deiodinase [Anaerolineae bacterium]|nr:deiodinase [Anaerolineae bacterium]